jgi:hypothetical protein
MEDLAMNEGRTGLAIRKQKLREKNVPELKQTFAAVL